MGCTKKRYLRAMKKDTYVQLYKEEILYSTSITFWATYMTSGKLYSGSGKFGNVILNKYNFQSYHVIVFQKNTYNLYVE